MDLSEICIRFSALNSSRYIPAKRLQPVNQYTYITYFSEHKMQYDMEIIYEKWATNWLAVLMPTN